MKPQKSARPVRRLCIFCTFSPSRHLSTSTRTYLASTASISHPPHFGAFLDQSTNSRPENPIAAFTRSAVDESADAARAPKTASQSTAESATPNLIRRGHAAVENYYNGRSASGYTRTPPPVRHQIEHPPLYPRGQDPVSQAIQNFRHEVAQGPARSIKVRFDSQPGPSEPPKRPRPRVPPSTLDARLYQNLTTYIQEIKEAGGRQPLERQDILQHDYTNLRSSYAPSSASLPDFTGDGPRRPSLASQRNAMSNRQSEGEWERLMSVVPEPKTKAPSHHNQSRPRGSTIYRSIASSPAAERAVHQPQHGIRHPPPHSEFSGWADSSAASEIITQRQQATGDTVSNKDKWNNLIERYKAQHRPESHVNPDKVKRPDMNKSEKTKNARRRSRDDDEDDGVRSSRRYKQDHEVWARQKEERKRSRQSEARQKAAELTGRKARQVHLPAYISNANLARLLNLQLNEFTARARKLGYSESSADYLLAAEDAALISMELGFEPVIEETRTNLVAAPWPKDTANLPVRPPVVTIMGHVDHGKTTILDYLRDSSVAANEHGGITQHIGAFSVPLSSGRTITFLDTPGHAAFLEMRQRGANVTDIVVLVVAADDGVMPQTIEAIKHAKAAKVAMIVAINKVDKPEANIDRVKQDMARQDVELEDFGGDVQVVPVSGKTGLGMKDLEENIMTLSEILDHRAPIEGKVEGWVLEASTKLHGRVATILVRRGILKPGTVFVAGHSWTRIKTLRNELGVLVESAGPGSPIEIDGWRMLPSPGDEMLEAEDEKQAASVVKSRLGLADSARLANDMEVINESRRAHREEREAREVDHKNVPWYRRRNQDRKLDGIFQDMRKEGGPLEAYFVIKADVGGSVEAVVNLISSLGNKQVRAHIIRSGAGPVTESDVEYADAAGGYILAFNTNIDPEIRRGADYKDVRVIEHSIIYRIADDVNQLLEEMLPETVSQRVTGEAEVLQLFTISSKANKNISIAGCRVRNGMVSKGSRVRVIRKGETVHDGILSTLKNQKKDVTEMKKDSECGMSFGEWSQFEIGDQIQCYAETRQKQKLHGGSAQGS